MIEIFGYIGCIFVIISMLMTSVVKLRVINIYNLIKLSKADGNHYDTIRGNKEDSYLTYFIKHYKEDMKKYFLENTLELSAADTIYTVCCEGVPAGVDRIFDMGRTTVNITGDASCSIIVSNLERRREAKLQK